jgi:Icc-related predicted phosphoesterase
MKLLLFSDVHRDLAAVRRLVAMATDVDVVVGAGDFASMHRGLEETIAALGAIETPSVVVAGNNETPGALREACAAAWPAAQVRHGEETVVADQTFFGLGGAVPTTPWDWSFDLSEDEAARALEACPTRAVLVLHSPPHGHLDGTGGAHLGSTAILAAIVRAKPPLAVCGHIHACWGMESRIGATRLVNPGPQGKLVEI